MVIKPLQNCDIANNRFSVFLAGSIEMGRAEDWQTKLANLFAGDDTICFLNPRRDNWDSSWKQDKNNTQFAAQVNWELDHLEKSDAIVIYFSPETRSPISMLELGLFAQSGKVAVCCPAGFWKKGNIDIVCERFQIPQAKPLEELASWIGQKRIEHQK